MLKTTGESSFICGTTNQQILRDPVIFMNLVVQLEITRPVKRDKNCLNSQNLRYATN
jgi:hypothetical protein